MKTLLVPLDFSEATKPLLAQAEVLAKDLQARVILLHVIEPLATAIPVGASMDVLTATPPPDPQNAEIIEKRMASFTENFATVETKVVVGLAIEDILSTAADEKADYIILASHGHGALYHLFSGSVVTGVLKRTKCPVVVVPVASH